MPFVARMLLEKSPPRKISKKTANAVEGKVCPDRFLSSYLLLLEFFESPERDTNSPIVCETDRPKPNQNKDLPELPPLSYPINVNR
jgi:hypothetical protein